MQDSPQDSIHAPVQDDEAGQAFRSDYLIVLALTLPALYPLIGAGIFASHDGLHHIFRLFDLAYCLRGGVLFPRWLPNLGFGYGYPSFNYYAPLVYYVAMPFVALDTGIILALKIVFVLGFFGAATGMYAVSRPFVGRLGGILAAMTYTYLPYHLADAYVRGALPEFLSFAIVPFALWGLYHAIVHDSRGHAATFGLGLACLILNHNPSVLLFGPIIVLFALVMAWKEGRWKRLVPPAIAAATAVFASAFYRLPALAEVGAIRASQIIRDPALMLSQLSPVHELVSPYLIYRYYPHQGRLLEHPFGIVPTVLALAAGALVRSTGVDGRPGRRLDAQPSERIAHIFRRREHHFGKRHHFGGDDQVRIWDVSGGPGMEGPLAIREPARMGKRAAPGIGFAAGKAGRG